MTTRLILIAACTILACSCSHEPTVAPADAQLDAAPDAEHNDGPVANAGPDATYLIGSTFSLDGSASTDSDGTLVGFQWSIDSAPAGSAATISDPLVAVASFTPDKVGTYTFGLLVTDDDGATDRDTVTVTLESGELTVDAGPDQTLMWRQTVSLSASYVSEAGPAVVSWSVLSHPPGGTAVPMPTNSLTPTFFGDKPGTYVAELKVTGPAGEATDTVTFTVQTPPPFIIDGNIVDIDASRYSGMFVIASTNPPRLRLLPPIWPTTPIEMAIPLSVTPTAIGVSETDAYVSVIHDSTHLTVARTSSLSVLTTMDIGTPLLDVRHGSATPRAYPAQAGSLLLINQFTNTIYPGGTVPGPSRGREYSSPERPLYALDLGPSAKLRRYDGSAANTPLVREWPYPAGQYPLGDDLWFVPSTIVVSTGHVFNISEDPSVDMTHRGVLAGDQPFEVVGVTYYNGHLVTLHNRITTPPQPPESQVRFYNYMTLALENVIPVPDIVVGGVPQPTLGHAISMTTVPGRVFVIGSAGTTYALITIPTP